MISNKAAMTSVCLALALIPCFETLNVYAAEPDVDGQESADET